MLSYISDISSTKLSIYSPPTQNLPFPQAQDGFFHTCHPPLPSLLPAQKSSLMVPTSRFSSTVTFFCLWPCFLHVILNCNTHLTAPNPILCSLFLCSNYLLVKYIYSNPPPIWRGSIPRPPSVCIKPDSIDSNTSFSYTYISIVKFYL